MDVPDGSPARPGPSRRMFLGRAGAAGAGVVVGAAAASGAAYGITHSAADDAVGGPGGASGGAAGTGKVAFYGARQAGIATAAQDRLMFAALDVTTTDVEALKRLLGTWTAMASQFTQGLPVSTGADNPGAPPRDTGEALGMPPENLTITIGFGPSLFDDRFGLAAKRPAALAPLPRIAGDQVIDPAASNGDLCIQACADDPQVVFHAVRNLVRAARGTATLRWSQMGFGRASATGAGQSTPRNLFGFKDGTANIHADDAAALTEHVWVGEEAGGPSAWMRGGSYLVARKIRMEIETWDADMLSDQERIFARAKISGAPLTGTGEFDPVDFAARAADGTPVIDPKSHVALAHPDNNNGVRILRRGYNYTDGQHAGTGKLDAGLFFIAFARNAHTQFVPLQQRLGANDLMNEYVTHVASGLWAIPPGAAAPGDWIGKALFA